MVLVAGCAQQAAGEDTPGDDKIFRVRNVGSSLSDEDKIQVRGYVWSGWALGFETA